MFVLLNMMNTIPNTMMNTMPNMNSYRTKNQHFISTHVCPFCAPLLFFGGRKLVIFLVGTSHRTGQLCEGFVYTL